MRISPGVWDKHPEPRVRETVQLIFDKFWELGTEGRVVRWMRANGVELPRRASNGLVRWRKPRRGDISKMLRNRAYMGDYVYGRTAADEPDDLGRVRAIPKAASEWTIFSNHHPSYVTPERWAEIQQRLLANCSRLVAPAGRGEALAQGILRCTVHDMKLRTSYYLRARNDEAKKRRASFICQPFMAEGNATYCCGMRAARVDEVIEAEVLRALSQPSLETIRAAAREALREHEALANSRRDEIRYAEHAAAEAERAYEETSSAHTYLKERLAQRLDDALRQLKDLQTSHRLYPLVPPLTLDDSELDELRALLDDLPRVWRHPAIGAEDRKAMVRRLIVEIGVTPSSESWTIQITWVGGARTSHDIPHHRGVTTIVQEKYRAGATDIEIVAHLDAAGIVHRIGKLAGQRYDVRAIRALVRRMKLQRPFDALAHPIIRQRRAARITHQAIADELNTAGIRHRLGRWNRHRVVTAAQRLRREGASQPAIPPLRPRVLELHKQRLSPLKSPRSSQLRVSRRPGAPP